MAKILARHFALSLEVIREHAKSLYRIWLERSFEEYLSLYVAGGISYISTPEFTTVVHRIKGDVQVQFWKTILEARDALGVPLGRLTDEAALLLTAACD